MTSKLVVNTIEADTGISSVSFGSSISLSSTSKFFFSAAGVDIGADTNINRPASGVLGFNINSDEKVRIDSSGRLGIGTDQFYDGTSKLEVRGRINTVGSVSTGSINTGDGTVVNVGSLTAHELQLITNNSTRMTIDEDGQVVFQPMTQTERDALNPEKGGVIFNQTTNKLQCWDGSSWNNLF